MLYRIIKGRWLFWRAMRARRLAERHKRRYLHSLVAVERHYGLRAVPGWRVPNFPY